MDLKVIVAKIILLYFIRFKILVAYYLSEFKILINGKFIKRK